MTYQEIKQMIASVGLPNAYYQFPDGTQQAPPFICFYFPGNDDFLADDTNYQKINELVVELYTDNKEFALEASVEAALTSAGLVYDREETYIGSERMYQISYTMEVVING